MFKIFEPSQILYDEFAYLSVVKNIWTLSKITDGSHKFLNMVKNILN